MKLIKDNHKINLKNGNKKVTSIVNFPNEPVKDGLLIWFDGRDGSNKEKTTTWIDRSGNGYNATLSGFGDFTMNEWDGYGLSSQVANRTVKLNNTSIPLPKNEITLEVYGINYDADLFSGLIADNTKSYYYWTNGKNAILWKNNKEFSCNGISAMPDNIITHMTFVFYENYTEIYKNGELIETKINSSPTNVTNFINGRIFCPYAAKHTNRVFSTRLYNRALTTQEVKQNYWYERSIYRGLLDKQLKMTSFTKISVENEWGFEDFIIEYNIDSYGMPRNTFDAYLLKNGEIIKTSKCSKGVNKLIYECDGSLSESCNFELYVECDDIRTDSVHWEMNSETQIPYISLYKIGPTFQPDEDVTFEYFIADTNFIEYREVELPEGYSYPTFKVEFYVDDILVKTYEDMNSADHFANLGKFAPGDHDVRAVCYDSIGRQSIDVWYYFRVWSEEYEIKNSEIYVMTEEDLVKYNISNVDDGPDYSFNGGTYWNSIAELYKNPTGNITLEDGKVLQKTIVSIWYSRIQPYWEDVKFDDYVAFKEATDLNTKRTKIKAECQLQEEKSVNNRIGLQQLFDDTKAKGYKKIIMLPGTYRIDSASGAEACLKCPDRFTIDMNQAKIKLNGCTGSSCVMMEIRCRYDSHVINGTFEGDFFEHDYSGSPNNSEWVSGVTICGDSQYCTFENVRMKHITGYGTMCGIGGPYGNNSSYVNGQVLHVDYNKKIDKLYIEKDGTEVEKINRCTTDFVDISTRVSDWTSLSRYLGYQGTSGQYWEHYISFYDENKEFICRYLCFQYRKVKIPTNAKYLRVTFLQSAETLPNDMSFQDFRLPVNSGYINVIHENCRCVGMAPAAAKQFIVEDCEWFGCGRNGAHCAYDAEDGWDMMQDFYHSRLNFHDNAINDFLICDGKNFVMEDFVCGNMYCYASATNSVIRNNNYSNAAKLGTIYCPAKYNGSGLSRVYNNYHTGAITTGEKTDDYWFTGKNELSKRYFNKRNNIVGNSENSVSFKCNIDGGAFCGELIKCKITNINTYNHKSYAIDSYFKNCGVSYHAKHYFENCYTNGVKCGTSANASDVNTIEYKNCIMHNTCFEDGYWSTGKAITIKDCVIINDNGSPIFNKTSYSTKYPMTFENCYIECANTSTLAAFYYFDDRSYADDPSNSNYFVHGMPITFKNCTLIMNDNDVLRFDTRDNLGANDMNLIFENNRLISSHPDRYFPETKHTGDLNVHKCEFRDTDFELEGFDIHICKKNMSVGEENFMLIKPIPMNATHNKYTIEINNDNIEISEDNVLFTCKKKGETTITVTSTNNSEIKVSKTIKIN